jgi:hypothetical protein
VSRAVIIGNRNVVRESDEPVYWAVLDDVSRLIGLSLTDIGSFVAGVNITVPGLVSVFVDSSDAKTAFSSMGPTRLTSKDGLVSVECGMNFKAFCFIHFLQCASLAVLTVLGAPW